MSFIRTTYKKFMKKVIQNTEIVPDVSQWRALLDSLPEPEDAIDVSYNKHLCRVHYFSPLKKCALNLAAAAGLLMAVPRLCKKTDAVKPVDNNALLLIQDPRIGIDDVIPPELLTRFAPIIYEVRKDLPVGALCTQAKALFFKCLRRHPFSFWFNLLMLKELSAHSHYLLNNQAKAAAIYVVESNVAYPVVTQLYEETGRKLISFMHGEYLMQIIHAYMGFSEYYVWDQCYADMFAKDLNCKIGEYKVYTPKKLQKKWELEKVEPEYLCTYYFSGESTQTIQKIALIFKELQDHGAKCKVRPHPRTVDHIKQIFAAFEGIKVETPSEISLQESLGQTKYVVGLSSTVLSEAYCEGREIVIDDLSDPVQYESLSSRKAVVLHKKHLLLSALCRSVAGDLFNA